MVHNKIILILSHSGDSPARLVAQKLRDRGQDLIFYEMDTVYEQSASFCATLDESGGIVIAYEGRKFRLSDVKAVWYRRPTNLSRGIEGSVLRRLQVERNIQALQDGIFANLPNTAWFNEPFAMRKAEGKLYQLALARSVGFKVPPTTITNMWEDVLQLPAREIIVKMPYAVMENDGQTADKVLFTTRLQNKRKRLPTDTSPFPAIWQPYKEKKREWRVTVVGDKVFAASIYTTDDAKHDWREHQMQKDKVTFRAEAFPEVEKRKSKELVKALGLKFGALDFIETPNGEVIFLEINPNGQYGWLETEIGLPISDAITEELISHG